MTHNKPKTYPRLATPIVFVPPEDLGEAVEAAIRLQRDHGDRGDRRHARLKYLVEEPGVDWIKARLEEAFGRPMAPARPMPRFTEIGSAHGRTPVTNAPPARRLLLHHQTPNPPPPP